MADLLQLYLQENSLKCRLRNKLLIDDIQITITNGRGCVAEGKGKKKKPTPKKRCSWEGGCTVRNCLSWFNREHLTVDMDFVKRYLSLLSYLAGNGYFLSSTHYETFAELT